MVCSIWTSEVCHIWNQKTTQPPKGTKKRWSNPRVLGFVHLKLFNFWPKFIYRGLSKDHIIQIMSLHVHRGHNVIHFSDMLQRWCVRGFGLNIPISWAWCIKTGTANSCWKTWKKINYSALQIRASITGTLEDGSDISIASASDSLRFAHAASAQLLIFSPWTFLFCWTQSASAYPPT